MAAASTDTLVRLQQLTELEHQDAPSRRMLVIVNPYATTVSARLKNLVVYALRGRYDVHAVDTSPVATRPRCVARPPSKATTWSSRSAATGPSTRPPTA